jgi:glycosyltransferase involved in cell wall biosynthesis
MATSWSRWPLGKALIPIESAMRILLWSNHRYGSCFGSGTGRCPREFPSGSGHYLHDVLAKGLAELGHEVSYHLPAGLSEPLPAGVERIAVPPESVDILHNYSSSRSDPLLMSHVNRHRIPWVATCHLDIQARGLDRSYAGGNWIFVSRSLARLYGRTRYVYNGIDPHGYIYSERKEDYYLFMSSMDWAFEKGLDTALALAADLGFRLVVAGTSGEDAVIQKIERLCSQAGIEYVGDVRGEAKAELLAGAQALLHPTHLYEGFGLVMAEALMSGTPVICSDRGACSEIISPEVGFVCRQESDYRNAIGRVTEISSFACREKAMREYHYHRMAESFVREYEAEIARPTEGNLIPNLETISPNAL